MKFESLIFLKSIINQCQIQYREQKESLCVFYDAKSFIFRFLCLLILHLIHSIFYIHSSVKNRIISYRICFTLAAEITENYFQKSHTNTCKNPFWNTVKTVLNCLFLITGFKLLKLLSVVCGFGWQTHDSKNSIELPFLDHRF